MVYFSRGVEGWKSFLEDFLEVTDEGCIFSSFLVSWSLYKANFCPAYLPNQ